MSLWTVKRAAIGEKAPSLIGTVEAETYGAAILTAMRTYGKRASHHGLTVRNLILERVEPTEPTA
jgi:hypothetical protein